MKTRLLIIAIALLSSNLLTAQNEKEKPFDYNPDNYDLMGLFSKKDKTVVKDTSWSKSHWSIFPAIAINPAIGTGYGFGITAEKYLGNPKTTRMSALNSTPIYTSKGQVFIPVRLTVYTNEKIFPERDLYLATFSAWNLWPGHKYT